jgi:hypothetical protein
MARTLSLMEVGQPLTHTLSITMYMHNPFRAIP